MSGMAEVLAAHLEELGDQYDLSHSPSIRLLAEDAEKALAAAGFGPVQEAATPEQLGALDRARQEVSMAWAALDRTLERAATIRGDVA